MSDWTWGDIQRQEDGQPLAPLAFTSDELAEHVHDNPDDPDCEIPKMAMERDMADRIRALEEENARLREQTDRDEFSTGLGEIDGGGE